MLLLKVTIGNIISIGVKMEYKRLMFFSSVFQFLLCCYANLHSGWSGLKSTDIYVSYEERE